MLFYTYLFINRSWSCLIRIDYCHLITWFIYPEVVRLRHIRYILLGSQTYSVFWLWVDYWVFEIGWGRLSIELFVQEKLIHDLILLLINTASFLLRLFQRHFHSGIFPRRFYRSLFAMVVWFQLLIWTGSFKSSLFIVSTRTLKLVFITLFW